MEPNNETNLDRILRRVQALLAKADSTEYPQEAQTLRDKAEELMQRYRIEEHEARERGEAPSLKPISRIVPLCDYNNVYRSTYSTIGVYILSHVGARGVYTRVQDEDGSWMYAMDVVGFESDVRYLEMLYTAARLVFSSRMEPRVDPSLSDAENIYNLRRSGMERINIVAAMGWASQEQMFIYRNNTGYGHLADWLDLSWETREMLRTDARRAVDGGTAKVTRLYKQECKRRGESASLTGKGFQVKHYKQAYEQEFTQELWSRLWTSRHATAHLGTIVLKSRKDEVDEAFYQKYPHLRPSGTVTSWGDVPAETEKQRLARLRREAKEAEKRTSSAWRAGSRAGAAAAREVDLGGVEPTRRLEG